MRLRILMAIALLFVVAFPPAAPAQEQQDATQAEEIAFEEASLSLDGEREARELAVKLMKRLRETDDFGPVVSEFFIDDFAERIHALVLSTSAESEFFMFCERHVLLQASADDIRRAYIALMNFWNQQELLRDNAWGYTKIKGKLEGKDVLQDVDVWRSHYSLREEAVPEDAFRIAQSDPLLNVLFDLVRYEKEGGEAGEEHQDDESRIAAAAIRDLARMRAFIEKLERSTALLRKGAERLRSDIKTLAALHGVSDNADEYEPTPGDPFRVYHLESETLMKEAFGLARGTVLIRARIRPYEMALARIDGRLQILGVYPDFDGD